MKRNIFLVLISLLWMGIDTNTSAQTVGVLYGMTNGGGGVVFKFDPLNSSSSIVFSFNGGSTGGYPAGDVMQASNGLLYGLTQGGGLNSYGVLYQINPITGTDSTLVNFNNSNGASPLGNLIQATNGLLYGMTQQGGPDNYGVLFSYDIANKKYDTLISFNFSNGANPYGSLVQGSNGLLYGMTAQGGPGNNGVLFSYDPVLGKYTVLKNFVGTNGDNPKGNLIQASDGLLYGMTQNGSSLGNGNIFSYNISADTITNLYSLTNNTGIEPIGSLMQASNGLLYGMTLHGGPYDHGSVFQYNIVGGIFDTLFCFNGVNGNNSRGSLIQGVNGILYGMTLQAGPSTVGEIFSYDIIKNVQSVIFDINQIGSYPYADLTEVMSAQMAEKDSGNRCYGDSSGWAVIHVRGGHYPLTYTWSNGASTDSVSGLKAGNYTASVKDVKGIHYDFSFTIKQPTLLKDSVTSITNIKCNGDNNGSIALVVKGGIKPYSYVWSPGTQTNTSFSGLIAGSYTFTATDSNHCVTPITITVSQPAVLKDSIDSFANVLCYGGNNGATRINVKGGTKPYLYSWSGSSGKIGSDSLVDSLIAGSYTCQVTDAHNCVTPISITITSPAVINDSTSGTSTPCTKSTGSAIVFGVMGGVHPYSYLWSPGGNTNAADTGLPSGTYICTITDSNNCKQKAFIVVPNTGGPRDSIITVANETCFGQKIGSATAGVKGGYLPYTFQWSPVGGSNTSANNLPANTYTFSVTDSIGCVSTATVSITEPTQLRDSTTSVTNVSCFGYNNGRIVIATKGGMPPYSYLWSGGAGIADSAINLAAGTYRCTITDLSNCNAPLQIIIVTSPNLLNTDTVATPTKCGTSNGSATAITTGGTRPYSYLWSNTAIDSSITKVSGGINYSCTITDAQGCINKINIIVPDTGGPRDTVLLNAGIKCYGSNSGTAIANVLKGTQPYTYSWAPSSVGTNGFAINLAAGTYTCTVTDATGCKGQSEITLSQPPQVTYIFDTIGVCYGAQSGGSAIINVGGGTPPYQYNWSSPGSTTDSLENVGPGSYVCLITDLNNCKTYATCTIAKAHKLSIDSIVSHPTSCPTCNDGWVQVFASGGIPPGDSIYYLYVWDSIVNASSIHNLDTGMYHVCVTTNYCINESVCDSVEVVTCINSISNLSNGVKVFPIPSRGIVNIQLPEMGMTTITVFDEMGRDIYRNVVSVSRNSNIISFNLEAYPNGIYTMQIRNTEAVITKKLVIQK